MAEKVFNYYEDVPPINHKWFIDGQFYIIRIFYTEGSHFIRLRTPGTSKMVDIDIPVELLSNLIYTLEDVALKVETQEKK